MHTFNGVGHFSQLGDLLNKEREQLKEEIANLDLELANIHTVRRQKEKRLEHIEALLGNEKPKPAHKVQMSSERGFSSSTEAILDTAEAILRERNKEPMHYRDLADELSRRGIVIGGKNPAGGLISRLSGDDRFVRPTSKGFYGLREDYPRIKRSVGERRRKRRKV